MTDITTLFTLLDKYGLKQNEKEKLLSIIKPIFEHDEFQRRLTSEFYHHDQITLGEHILEVTILTYLLAKKDKKADLEYALNIAMLHDLYCQPWQNNPNSKSRKFYYGHGYRHPIESVINSSIWFPDIFKEGKKTKIITDGIVHHMYPLPVMRFKENEINMHELKNFKYTKKMNQLVKESLIESSNRSATRNLSITPSQYIEGVIVSNADKIVTLGNFKGSNINGIVSLITKKNKNLEKIKTKF